MPFTMAFLNSISKYLQAFFNFSKPFLYCLCNQSTVVSCFSNPRKKLQTRKMEFIWSSEKELVFLYLIDTDKKGIFSIVTINEKWCYYENPKQIKLWLDPRESLTSHPKEILRMIKISQSCGKWICYENSKLWVTPFYLKKLSLGAYK